MASSARECPDNAAALSEMEKSSIIETSTSKGKEKADQRDGEVDDETHILKSLFDAQGIHSAMNHDAIMNAHDGEKVRLEETASQVAQKAAEALRQSRMLRSRDSISVPTWTGRSGAAGAPSSVRKRFGSTKNSQLLSTSKPPDGSSGSGTKKPNGFAVGASSGKALSSSELLARIRGTNEEAVNDGFEHQFGPASGSNHRSENVTDRVLAKRAPKVSAKPPEVIIRQILTFIQQKGGRTSSSSIVQHFKDRIPSQDLALFKNLLKEIATLEKDTNGSTWVLKPEYQQ
eukprot:TRINITY_DN18326_c0_g1_i1.p1 TRINITY_DN18326_c0_g1~~TRINITY_DN18326_c0_g1_i1.p1  ORF type:complete len:299 (+),score=60.25 TRINITY_DN18326_c0_g1_i1:36-899(+)